MKKLRLLAVASMALILTAIGQTKPRATAYAAAPQFGSTCVTYVPREWGTYRGGSTQTGLAFEDSAGTLRFITNLPCGGAPIVALEVRRSAAK